MLDQWGDTTDGLVAMLQVRKLLRGRFPSTSNMSVIGFNLRWPCRRTIGHNDHTNRCTLLINYLSSSQHIVLVSNLDSRVQKTTRHGRVRRRRPIFPRGCPRSIVRAEELNYRVRDGNGCTLFAIVTGSPAHPGGCLDREYITTGVFLCQYLLAREFGKWKN